MFDTLVCFVHSIYIFDCIVVFLSDSMDAPHFGFFLLLATIKFLCGFANRSDWRGRSSSSSSSNGDEDCKAAGAL
jgi:hypothetical protein